MMASSSQLLHFLIGHGRWRTEPQCLTLALSEGGPRVPVLPCSARHRSQGGRLLQDPLAFLEIVFWVFIMLVPAVRGRARFSDAKT
jgi:hypothetical protein